MIKVYTEEEARERGLKVATQQPEDEQCEFCGRALHHIGYGIGGEVMAWHPVAERCTCAEAKEKWARYDEEHKAAEQERERLKRYGETQERIQRLLGASGIGKRFQNRRFETFKADTAERARAKKIAVEYAGSFEKRLTDGIGLYIEGTNGTGKTHLAAAIAIQVMTEKRIACICKTAGDMLSDIKEAYNKDSVSEQDVLKVYKDVPLLVIDDLGKEQCSDWSVSTLYAIINDRYEKMKPIIITTNYNSDDLQRALTPRGYDGYKAAAIVSRLKETSKILTMAWEDFRVA